MGSTKIHIEKTMKNPPGAPQDAPTGLGYKPPCEATEVPTPRYGRPAAPFGNGTWVFAAPYGDQGPPLGNGA